MFYVYELVDPRDDRVFYVGKGRGQRDRMTLSDGNCSKMEVIKAIKTAGLKVIVRRFADGLTEAEAFRLERERIYHYRVANLTNLYRGRYAGLLDTASHLINRLAKPTDDWSIERKLYRLLLKGQLLEVILDLKRGYYDDGPIKEGYDDDRSIERQT
jgi:hypothetical protein